MGKIKSKPKCKLTGTDGNIFALMGKASRALKQAGQAEEAKEMCAKIKSSKSYCQALGVISSYVDIS